MKVHLIPLILFITMGGLDATVVVLKVTIYVLFITDPGCGRFFIITILKILFVFTFVGVTSCQDSHIRT